MCVVFDNCNTSTQTLFPFFDSAVHDEATFNFSLAIPIGKTKSCGIEIIVSFGLTLVSTRLSKFRIHWS